MSAGTLCTIRGLDALAETLTIPALTPEQAAAERLAEALAAKMMRGAYHTARRLAKARRRWERARPAAPELIIGKQLFGQVTSVAFDSPGSTPISWGYAAGAAMVDGFAAGIALG